MCVSYLQEGLSSLLVLKLAVSPLQDVNGGLTDVDPEGWKETGSRSI
jgi:hypothetical protein